MIVDIPNVPTLTATTTCAGTAVTFTASSVSGATGYQWAGTGVAASSGTARTKASNATTAGNYVAQVRSYITASGISCFSAYTSNVTGVIVATPAVPILTQDGPECVGTAITFTTSSVSGATGYQWNGTGVTASSGTARTTTSKTTTAGSYIAQVRAYRTASGITCYSAYTANVTGVINAPGARDAAPHVTCGCVSGLIAVNGYCRNLAADGASSYTGCGVELKLNPTATAVSYSETTCPSGWRLPTATEAKCAYNAVIWRPSNVDYIWTSTVSGCDGGVAGNTHCALHVKDINCYVACYDGPGDYINAGKTWAVPNTHTSGAIYCVR